MVFGAGCLLRMTKMKLIRTKLLRQTKVHSPVSIATASHLDYCLSTYERMKREWTFNEYTMLCIGFLQIALSLVLIPLCRITHGVILYPVWIFRHIKVRKHYIKLYGVNRLNQSARELLREINTVSKT